MTGFVSVCDIFSSAYVRLKLKLTIPNRSKETHFLEISYIIEMV